MVARNYDHHYASERVFEWQTSNMPTPAKKSSTAKKSSLSAKGTRKSNYHVRVSKNFESYVDIYREISNSLSESADNFSLKDIKNEETIWQILCNWDPDAELDQAEFLGYLGLSVSVVDYGSCSKCELKFEDECSEYLPKHCIGCGAKRSFSKISNLVEAKESDFTLIRKGLWEATTTPIEIQNHLKKKRISRYWRVNFDICVEFDLYNKTLAQVEKYAKSHEIWLADYDNMSGLGAAPLGICAKCERDFMPREKFCPKCGSKKK